MAPEIQVTRKKIELFFLVSQSLRNSIHLSNPFYLCYCNNKLPGQTQSCSLAMLAFQRVLFHHWKNQKCRHKGPLGYLGTNLGLPCTMMKAKEELARHCYRSALRTCTPTGTNITGFGHRLRTKPKPVPFVLLQSHFLNIFIFHKCKKTFWTAILTKKSWNLECPKLFKKPVQFKYYG